VRRRLGDLRYRPARHPGRYARRPDDRGPVGDARQPAPSRRTGRRRLDRAARLLSVFQRQMRVREDRRNPVLARSLTRRHAPDAPGRSPGARVAPAARVPPARKMFRERTCLTGRTADREGVSGCGKGQHGAAGFGLPRYLMHGGTSGPARRTVVVTRCGTGFTPPLPRLELCARWRSCRRRSDGYSAVRWGTSGA
jgi:hypothetical protein